MVVYGMSSRLSLPDEQKLIWEGNLEWWKDNGDTPHCEEFDWLIDVWLPMWTTKRKVMLYSR